MPRKRSEEARDKLGCEADSVAQVRQRIDFVARKIASRLVSFSRSTARLRRTFSATVPIGKRSVGSAWIAAPVGSAMRQRSAARCTIAPGQVWSASAS